MQDAIAFKREMSRRPYFDLEDAFTFFPLSTEVLSASSVTLQGLEVQRFTVHRRPEKSKSHSRKNTFSEHLVSKGTHQRMRSVNVAPFVTLELNVLVSTPTMSKFRSMSS